MYQKTRRLIIQITTLMHKSALLGEIEMLKELSNSLDEVLSDVGTQSDLNHHIPVSAKISAKTGGNASNSTSTKRVVNRKLGMQARSEFVVKASEAGIVLTPSGNGSREFLLDNMTVFIAFATERNPNRWFHGIPDRSYDAVVFLCSTEQNGSLEKSSFFIIPGREWQPIYTRLSISGPERKVNIKKNFSKWYLDGPGFQIELSEKKDDLTPLKS